MGVFARLLGRSKAKREASAAEVPGDDAPENASAPEAVEGAAPAEAPGSSEDGHEGVAAGADGSGTRASDGAEGAEGAESAEIPKQQSADEAADSEAGEGARR
ncbi:hypothetical protein ABZ467_26385 [Streptomyces sp. NPDC005727]|uniref:hypothetical protein n=1 Tax=unclassified Streptomyces TaxID=2593676 RepID=UPI0033D4A962